jgi:type IV secretion system protein VirB4
MDEPAERQWLLLWLRQLCTHYANVWTSEDDEHLKAGLEALLQLPKGRRRLLSFSLFLPAHLQQALQPWLGEEGHDALFDADDNSFEWGTLLSIEMGEIMKDEGRARLFMSYAFHQLDRLLAREVTGPTLIYIEEAWFMLAHPVFREQIRDWLKTLPKKMAHVILATQSLEDLEKSGLFGSIADNIPTRIFMANREAMSQKSLYQQQFGLNDEQIIRITQAEPKRQFLVVTPEESRLIDCPLPMSVVNLLRSDVKAQRVFDEVQKKYPGEWRVRYPEAIQNAL